MGANVKTFLVLVCRRVQWPAGQVMELRKEFEADSPEDAREAVHKCLEKAWEEMADNGRMLPIPAQPRFFSMLEYDRAHTEVISVTEIT